MKEDSIFVAPENGVFVAVDATRDMTVGEARRVAHSNPRVDKIFRKLGTKNILFENEINKVMGGEDYRGWRALNMLIVGQEAIAGGNFLQKNIFSSDVDEDSIILNENRIPLFAYSEEALILLGTLSEAGFLSAEVISKINQSKGFETWRSAFSLARAGWVIDTEAGMRITQEGFKVANIFFPKTPRDKEYRDLGMNMKRIAFEGESQLSKFMGNIQAISEKKIRNEITAKGIFADSLEDVDPMKLRDLIIASKLKEKYFALAKWEYPNDSVKLTTWEIEALNETVTLNSCEEFETYLEMLGSEHYKARMGEDEVREQLLRAKLEEVKDVFECLKFIWGDGGFLEPDALQIVQQSLQIPFWSENWRFNKGANTAYKGRVTKKMKDEEKIWTGSIVKLDANLLEPDDPRIDKEFEVIDVKQGLASAFFSRYQHVYVKDSDNWVHAYYLANLKFVG